MPLTSRLLRFGLAMILLSGVQAALAPREVQAGDLTVTTALDEYDISGAGTGCSIREAIQAANTDLPFGGCQEGTGVDTISIPAGTYTLTRSGINEDANDRGDLDIASEVILAGDGVGVTILQAGTRPDLSDSVDRVLHVLGCGGRLTVTGLTVQHGFAQSNLLPNYRGGGIYIDGGVLDAQDCAIRGNRALQHGGGILNLGGNVTVDNCSLEGNVADYYGGAVYNRDGPFLISDSSLANNESVFWGGAVFNTSGGKLAIQRSTLDNNRVTGPGTPATSLAGGAIFCQPGAGPTTVEASTLSRNYGGDLGGAIYAAATVIVSNSTLSGNTADQGGGVYFVGTANISSSTITENQALGGGGGIRRGFELNINNTIVAGNPTGADCYGSFGDVLGDHNLDGDGSCGFNAAGDISVADPRLGPLLDHGGPTRTHALLFDSPAIDAGSTGGCRDHQNMSIASDQRSEARDDLRCDIGAFELVYQGSPTVSKAVTGGGEVTFGPTLVRIAVTTQGSLTGVSVTRAEGVHPQSIQMDGQWWSMTAYAASGGGDYVVSVTLPHDVFPHVETQVCRYQGGAGIGAWDCGRDTSDFTSVTRRGLRSLSHDWAVGGVVATPTASVTTTPPATRTPTSSPAVTPTPTATPAGTRTPTVAPQRLHLPAILRVRW